MSKLQGVGHGERTGSPHVHLMTRGALRDAKGAPAVLVVAPIDAAGRAPAGTPGNSAGSEHLIPPKGRTVVSFRACCGGGLEAVQLLRVFRRHQPGLDEVKRAEKPIADPETAGMHDGITHRSPGPCPTRAAALAPRRSRRGIRVLEPQHDELDESNRHVYRPFVRSPRRLPRSPESIQTVARPRRSTQTASVSVRPGRLIPCR